MLDMIDFPTSVNAAQIDLINYLSSILDKSRDSIEKAQRDFVALIYDMYLSELQQMEMNSETLTDFIYIIIQSIRIHDHHISSITYTNMTGI